MTNAADIYGTAFRNGTATLLARVVGSDGEPIGSADISEVHYSVYVLDDQDADARTPVTGHTDQSLDPGAVIFDTLQNDTLWTVDTMGYNFRHTLDVSTYPAFATAGRRYLIEYVLTPTSGQVILARFRMQVI